MSIVSPLPFTFVPNTLILSSQVNSDLQHIVDQVNANAAPSGGNTSTLIQATATLQQFPVGVGTTVINVNASTIDVLNEFNLSSHKFTPTVAGTYFVTGIVTILAGAGSNNFTLGFQLTGGGLVASNTMFNISATDSVQLTCAGLVNMTLTDYLQFAIFCGTSTTNTVNVGDGPASMSIMRVG